MNRDRRNIAIIGLGYVGLTVANAFAKVQPILGFDISEQRIAELARGYDRNNELTPEDLSNPNIIYSTHAEDLIAYDFFIIDVLTLIDENNRPDFRILLKATEMVAEHLKKGDVVVFESTIYPGGTEEHCIPLLEKISGLKCGHDFGVGYSPERINPGDKIHGIETTPKIISASDSSTLEVIEKEYKRIAKNIHLVSKIAVAEAAKVIENTQRDVNIALMNEMSLLFHQLGLDSKEVIAAIRTKWNALPFYPGLVGGYCIGLNTYFLTHRAESVGLYPELLLAGRRINESMPLYIASNTIKELIHKGFKIKGARIGILGLTYKENSPSLCYSKSLQVFNELKSYDTELLIHDEVANPAEIYNKFGVAMTAIHNCIDMDAIVILVPHKAYVEMPAIQVKKMLKNNGVLVDITHCIDAKNFEDTDITVWNL